MSPGAGPGRRGAAPPGQRAHAPVLPGLRQGSGEPRLPPRLPRRVGWKGARSGRSGLAHRCEPLHAIHPTQEPNEVAAQFRPCAGAPRTGRPCRIPLVCWRMCPGRLCRARPRSPSASPVAQVRLPAVSPSMAGGWWSRAGGRLPGASGARGAPSRRLERPDLATGRARVARARARGRGRWGFRGHASAARSSRAPRALVGDDREEVLAAAGPPPSVVGHGVVPVGGAAGSRVRIGGPGLAVQAGWQVAGASGAGDAASRHGGLRVQVCTPYILPRTRLTSPGAAEERHDGVARTVQAPPGACELGPGCLTPLKGLAPRSKHLSQGSRGCRKSRFRDHASADSARDRGVPRRTRPSVILRGDFFDSPSRPGLPSSAPCGAMRPRERRRARERRRVCKRTLQRGHPRVSA